MGDTKLLAGGRRQAGAGANQNRRPIGTRAAPLRPPSRPTPRTGGGAATSPQAHRAEPAPPQRRAVEDRSQEALQVDGEMRAAAPGLSRPHHEIPPSGTTSRARKELCRRHPPRGLHPAVSSGGGVAGRAGERGGGAVGVGFPPSRPREATRGHEGKRLPLQSDKSSKPIYLISVHSFA